MKRRRKNKKAQMEILGLAIVVVLVIIGFLFVVRIIATQDPSDTSKNIRESQFAANFISTMLKVNVPECRNLDVGDLLDDCALSGALRCSDTQTSCQKAEEIASQVLTTTLEERKKPFFYSVYMEDQDPLMEIGESCPGARRSKVFIRPTGFKDLNVRLDLCD